jgi:hypothetical protein
MLDRTIAVVDTVEECVHEAGLKDLVARGYARSLRDCGVTHE